MSVLGNIVWLVFGGILIFLEYIVAGVAFCLTIIAIPFGIASFKLALLALLPFGREVVTKPRGTGIIAVVANVVWIILFGLAIAFSHVIFAALFAITIIGLPFAKQHMKLARLGLTPFGLEVR